MAVRPDSSSTFTFGDFQLDCRIPELKKRGRTVRVPQQPVQILSLLIAAAGEVVTREDLRDAVWAHDTHVDFDRGINKAINRLRQVLGDRSERPRFIETVPRRGYRFIAAVTQVSAPVRVISAEVRETLLKARHFGGKRTVAALARSVDYFRETIERDPDYADAWGGLAETYVMLGIFGLKPSHEAFPAARSAAKRALALDGSSAQAHTLLADVRKFFEWDWEGAERAYRRALDIDPRATRTHQEYAQLLAMLARHAEAWTEIEAARQCDPVSPIIHAFFSYILLEARQYDRAVVAGLKAVEFEPTAPPAHFSLGRAYAKVGELQLAIESLTEAVRIAGSVPRFESCLGYAYARAGQRTEAEAILDRFSRGPAASVISPVASAMIWLGLGDTDAALAGLERAYAAREPGTVIAGDPFFSELAPDPRHRELMARLRLPVQPH
jgi:DNA-binding winged helix-turn-helix (wHTH) protein/tetratricopeptide (TPR) repeat protein